jgi:hypothetical protein
VVYLKLKGNGIKVGKRLDFVYILSYDYAEDVRL